MERFCQLVRILCMSLKHTYRYWSTAGVVIDDNRLVEENQTVHVNTNYVIKSDDGAYIYVR